MNCNINSSGLYDVNSYNLIATNATVLSTLNVAGNIIGSGTALTNLNYDSITNKPSLTLFNNPITCVSSLNVSGNSNLNNLNVSGSSYCYGHLYAQQNFYCRSMAPAFSLSIPNIGVNISTRGNEGIYLNASGTNILTSKFNNTSINSSLNVSGNSNLNSSLNVSGATTLNNSTTCLSTLNVVGDVNTSGLSVFTMNSNITNLNNTSTTIFNNLNSLSTYGLTMGWPKTLNNSKYFVRNGDGIQQCTYIVGNVRLIPDNLMEF